VVPKIYPSVSIALCDLEEALIPYYAANNKHIYSRLVI